ncbi:hypothetical protein QYM36_004458 [Artemia franciscana]|uniref:Peptidase M3A/M3B catalytic domain-containing protein n=1 Tax=Artemia franciscana TaxID=6661 RepID=A0AA88L865_ARTSF|nr:hypothetical protein QYM36_004458 [Artemia franciscana]
MPDLYSNSLVQALLVTLKHVAKPLIFENLKALPEIFDSLEKDGAQLETAWNVSRTTRIVNASQMDSEVFQKIQSKVRKAKGSKFQSRPLHATCKNLLNEDLAAPEKALLKKYVREGKMNGLELSEKGLSAVKQNMAKLEEAKSAYRNRVKVSTEKFQHLIGDKEMMKDFPSDLLRAMAMDKNKPSQGPWCVTLEGHILPRFLEYCPDKEQRWNAWLANRSRASSGSVQQGNNNAEVGNIRARRLDQAKHLGFQNYVEMSLDSKMAESIDSILSRFKMINEKAKPAMDKEIEELQNFAAEKGHSEQLQLWDIPYWRRLKKRAQYSCDEGEVREYFPLPKVIQGVLSLTEEMFGITIHEDKNASSWHSDVKLYKVRDENGEDLGHFYLDPYLRPGAKLLSRSQKGWVIPERPFSALNRMKPSATLVFNFPPPLHGLPSLLTFEEVQAIFKNVGFVMQLLLTKSPYHEINPINNAPWEAVEAPGEFFQLLSMDATIIERISSHFESGYSIPADIVNKLVNSQRHMSAFDLCNEMYLAHFDLECYSSKKYWLDITKKLWAEYMSFPLDGEDSHPCSFVDIFSENWAASYYCHLWARMIGADIFAAFQEAGLNNSAQFKDVGQRLRNTFLANSGMQDSNELFRQFRGRDFNPDALLTVCGLKKTKKH